MMRADTLNSNIYPVRTEITVAQQILISHIFSADNRESEEFIGYKTLLQVYSTDEEESENIIVDESSTEKSDSECVHKNVNK